MNFGHKKLYINGNLTETSNEASFDIICPGDETKVTSIAWATREDTESALQSAQKGMIEAFTEGLQQKFSEPTVGFSLGNEPDMGPPANKQSVDKMHQIVKDAIDQGGNLIIGGSPMVGAGYNFPLTIVQMNNQKAKILQEENFGPVAMLVPFSTWEEVLELANNSDAGLASYVYSINEKTLDFFVGHLAFGEVHLNGLKFDIYLPHGGIKNSGIGVDCSTYA